MNRQVAWWVLGWLHGWFNSQSVNLIGVRVIGVRATVRVDVPGHRGTADFFVHPFCAVRSPFPAPTFPCGVSVPRRKMEAVCVFVVFINYLTLKRGEPCSVSESALRSLFLTARSKALLFQSLNRSSLESHTSWRFGFPTGSVCLFGLCRLAASADLRTFFAAVAHEISERYKP